MTHKNEHMFADLEQGALMKLSLAYDEIAKLREQLESEAQNEHP